MDWINSLPGSVEPCSIESLNDDCTAVLLPQFDFLKQSQKFIKRIYKQLFELELNGWYTDKTLWPRNRSYKLFCVWFQIEIHTEVFDFGKGNITVEEY